MKKNLINKKTKNFKTAVKSCLCLRTTRGEMEEI